MSQSVLSIDATQVPARAIVALVDRSSVKIVSAESVELDLVSPEEEEQVADEVQPTKTERRYLPLSTFIEGVDARITHAVLILHPQDYLSLNLSLPFRDYKTLSRVVDLEVQDQVPFDVSEFLIQPRIVGETEGLESDVHVSATPREYLRRVLVACRREGFEPTIISTASSALAGLFLLEPERILSNSAIILAKGDFACITVSIHGQVKTDRLIHEEDPRVVLTELRRTLLATERRYGQKIERLYLIGDAISPSVLAKETGREVTPVEEMKDGCGLAAMGAVFAQDEVTPILTNFRIREFAYNPYIKEVLRGARILLPWCMGALLLCILSMAGVYYSRQRELATLRGALSEQIRRAAPELQVTEGQEVRAVQEENRRIDRQLKELGSSSRVGALEIIAELSKDVAAAGELSVRRITVNGGGMNIQGTAPDYAAVEKLERIMKTKKPALYCKIRKTTGASAAGQPDRRSFTFDLRICE